MDPAGARLPPLSPELQPDSFNINDFVRIFLLVRILLGEAKWGKALDLKVKEFFLEISDP